jgi:hypothetical protein
MTDNVIWSFSELRHAQLMAEAGANLAEAQARLWVDYLAQPEAKLIPFSTDEYNEPPCA